MDISKILNNPKVLGSIATMEGYWKSVNEDINNIAKITNDNFKIMNDNMKELDTKLDQILKLLEDGSKRPEE